MTKTTVGNRRGKAATGCSRAGTWARRRLWRLRMWDWYCCLGIPAPPPPSQPALVQQQPRYESSLWWWQEELRLKSHVPRFRRTPPQNCHSVGAPLESTWLYPAEQTFGNMTLKKCFNCSLGRNLGTFGRKLVIFWQRANLFIRCCLLEPGQEAPESSETVSITCFFKIYEEICISSCTKTKPSSTGNTWQEN